MAGESTTFLSSHWRLLQLIFLIKKSVGRAGFCLKFLNKQSMIWSCS